MFGGLTVFGSWGILLGPLAVRLGVEAMELLYEMRVAANGRD
jgi:predicted PurR-regulated permease PerM